MDNILDIKTRRLDLLCVCGSFFGCICGAKLRHKLIVELHEVMEVITR